MLALATLHNLRWINAAVSRGREVASSLATMNEINKLAEQHIRASQSRLLHIDELMARARAVNGKAAAPLQDLMARVEQDRERLSRHIEQMRQQPHDKWPGLVAHGKGLEGLLEAAGLQLEKALAAVFK